MAEQVRRRREPRDPVRLLIGAEEKDRLGIPAEPPEQDVGDREVFELGGPEPTPAEDDFETLFGPKPLQTLAEQECDPQIAEGATVYALIYKAGSINREGGGSYPYTRTMRVARGRGKGTIENATLHRDDSEEGYQVPTVSFEMSAPESETGYMIRFIPKSLRKHPFYDALTAPTLESVPLTETGLHSIPGWAQAKLRRDGHLKCSGMYDEKARVFEQFSLGWQDHPSNQADALARILEELGPDQFAAAVYYFLHTEASEQYAHPEAIAEIRDIKPSSVMDRVKKAEQMLESSSSRRL